MAWLDTRFTRPSFTAVGMGVLGVLSVGLISTGLWYDSHRSAQAVERARMQVESAQTAGSTAERIAGTTSERRTEPSSTDPTTEEQGTEEPTEAHRAAVADDQTDPVSQPGAPATSVPTVAPVPQVAAARQVPIVPAAPAPAAAAAAPAEDAGGTGAEADAAGDAAGGVDDAGEGGLDVRQPEGPRPAPGFPDLLRPFLPRPNVAPQPNTVRAEAAGAGAADAGAVAPAPAGAAGTDED
ncbi:hypothetical protein [Dietzia sp. ANT_WB102]|uniref:hypothetical protein n=1 Tax=Dietzia sp. ANT_WB102 TaxID=2597345 RepID=UPI0011EDB82B|nr:hypothetical protein [Dietzia sp. ANT_WB102]KAA0917948.1 hypothetical protein FQ137_00600 [Dietzia sp. ANT_WB102]